MVRQLAKKYPPLQCEIRIRLIREFNISYIVREFNNSYIVYMKNIFEVRIFSIPKF